MIASTLLAFFATLCSSLTSTNRRQGRGWLSRADEIPFFISLFFDSSTNFRCPLSPDLLFSFTPPTAPQHNNTLQKTTNPAPTNKELDHGSNAFCTNHRQALVRGSRQAFRIRSLCHARMANQYHQSCQTLPLSPSLNLASCSCRCCPCFTVHAPFYCFTFLNLFLEIELVVLRVVYACSFAC